MLHWQPAPTPITPQSNRHAAVLNSAISREWDQELRRADPQHGRNGKATKVEDVGVLFIVLHRSCHDERQILGGLPFPRSSSGAARDRKSEACAVSSLNETERECDNILVLPKSEDIVTSILVCRKPCAFSGLLQTGACN